MTVDLGKYLGLFVSEAGDHLAKLAADLVRLEAAARAGEDTGGIVDGLFRHAHSVKGMAGAMEQGGIATLAHRVEDLVDVFRRQAALPDGTAVDLLLAAIDALVGMVERAGRGEKPDYDPVLAARLEAQAERSKGQGARSPEAAVRADRSREVGAEASPDDPVRAERSPQAGVQARPAPELPPTLPRRRVDISVEVSEGCPVPSVRGFLVVKKLSRLGALVHAVPPLQDLKAGRLPDRKLAVGLETSEPLAAIERTLAQISDLAAVQVADAPRERPAPAPPPRPARDDAAAREGGRTIRVRVELLDSFLDAVGELILATARLRELGRGLPEAHRPALEDGVDRLSGTVKDLHDKVMAVRMTPLALVTDPLPRVARDLARRVGKQVEVLVRGVEIEVDRAVLDELADPLQHVLRNAVDHGIEAPHLRLLAGKSATGRVTVSARRVRDRVLIEIADDGKGMDAERLRAAAVARGVLDEAAARLLSDRDAFLLACLPGLSTADAVTEVSGRGVGMDAVKRTVEALGGAVEVESTPGLGTRWTLRLPLTVAVQPVLLVGVAGEVLGVPIAKVLGAAQVDVARLDRAQGTPLLAYDGQLVPVHDLGALLGFAEAPAGMRSVVVAEGDAGRVGLAVDALLGQQEAVLKPLARPLDRVAGLSAVTVLGSGRPVFILDVQRLLAA
jgi:two-component system, chemotaxis family, sensor kinase CheA